jgi:hypothetical protein
VVRIRLLVDTTIRDLPAAAGTILDVDPGLAAQLYRGLGNGPMAEAYAEPPPEETAAVEAAAETASTAPRRRPGRPAKPPEAKGAGND